MLDFISIGDTTRDIFLQIDPTNVKVFCELRREECELRLNYADKIPVAAKFDAMGGNASNAAVSAARLGLQTALYTHIGIDPSGQQIRQELQTNGVLVDYIIQDTQSGTNYNTVLSVDGERTILTFHQPRTYALPQLVPAKWVYLTSMKDGWEKVIPALQAYLAKTGAQLCYQPGTFQLRQRTATSDQILKQVGIIFMNKEEAVRYLGLKDMPDMKTLLDGIRALGPQRVVITDGGNGSFATDGAEYLQLGILPDAPRIESTGAGDSFASATVVALSLGKPLSEALRWGLIQASSVIQQVGAQAGLLTRPALEASLEKHTTIIPTTLLT